MEFSDRVREATNIVTAKLKRKDTLTEQSTVIDLYGQKIPVIRSYRNGQWQKTVTTATFPELTQRPDEIRYIEKPEETFPFPVIGRLVDISDGAYKLVAIDQDGNAGRVIKAFGMTGYKTLDQAQDVVRKTDRIYQVVQETTGLPILPYELHAAQDPRNGLYMVYEIQKRGVFVPPELAAPPEALPAVKRQISLAHQQYSEVTEPRLLQEGLISKHPYIPGEIADHLSMYTAYDLVTGQVVIKDVVDAIFSKVGINDQVS